MIKTKLARLAAQAGKRLPRRPPGVDRWLRDPATWLVFGVFGVVSAVVVRFGFRHGKPASEPARQRIVEPPQVVVEVKRPAETVPRPVARPAPAAGRNSLRPAPVAASPPSPAEIYERVFGEQDAIEAELAVVLTRCAPHLSSDQAARVRLLRRVCGTGQFLRELTAARTVGPLPDELQRSVQQLSDRWTATEAVVSQRERQERRR